MAEVEAPTDEALMAQLQGGSERALQLLHQRYAPLIFALATRSLGPANADDLVQEVLLAVWTARDSYQPARGRLRPWLLEIAHTRVLNELRRRRRHPGDGAVAVEDFAAAGEDAPETAAWHAQRQRVLNAALAELPPAEGQALRLAFFEELSHTEVAAFLRTPLGTVKTRIRSGLARLFQRLTPVLGPTLLVLALAAAGLWSLRGELSREDRALRMLSLSDSQLLHLGAAEAAASETHGSFRWHPGLSTAVVTLSHAPQPSSGVHFWAWADIGGHWIALCELTPDATGRAIAIAENPALGELPRQIAITAEQMPGSEPSAQRIVGWTGP